MSQETITKTASISKLVSDTRWTEVRAIRNAKLKGADKLIETAVDLSLDETKYRQYRQALRDIPQTYSNPEDVVWPQKPALPQSA